jgi:hypothetical protein
LSVFVVVEPIEIGQLMGGSIERKVIINRWLCVFLRADACDDKGLKFTAERADCFSTGGKKISVPAMFLSSALKVCTDGSANYQA